MPGVCSYPSSYKWRHLSCLVPKTCRFRTWQEKKMALVGINFDQPVGESATRAPREMNPIKNATTKGCTIAGAMTGGSICQWLRCSQPLTVLRH